MGFFHSQLLHKYDGLESRQQRGTIIMTWFMNPFANDFWGVWVIDDRAHHPTFPCPTNTGRGDNIVCAWAEATGTPKTYDLSGNDADGDSTAVFTLQYSLDSAHMKWVQYSIDITDDTNVDYTIAANAVRPFQIVDVMNADIFFSSYFEASMGRFTDNHGNRDRILIKQKLPVTRMKFFVVKGRAETVLQFNARAGVSELPTYFRRHTVFNSLTPGASVDPFTVDVATGGATYKDGINQLIELDPNAAGGSVIVDDAIVGNAVDKSGNNLGYDNTTIQEDWELVQGQSSTFTFTSVLAGGSANPIVETIESLEYPAGAKAGDLAKKVVNEYDASGDIVYQYVIPYTLLASDLITPP
jgi:hypothetical protein